jgi:iron complex outermembrane receptor protein
MKRTFTFCLAFFMLTWPAFGQQPTLKEKIIDVQNQQPLPGATVSTGNIGTITDAADIFTLNIPTGVQTIQVAYLGYIGREFPVASFSAAEPFTIELEPTNLQLSEIIVTGFDSMRKLLTTAGSVGLVTPRDIARHNQTDLAPMLNHIPELHVQSSNVLNRRFFIRGIGFRQPGSSGRIKMYINDLPLTDAAGQNELNEIDPNTIGRIEVIKGPASNIYGATIGGVVNINTKRAENGQNGVEATYLAGSFGLQRATTTVRLDTGKSNIMFIMGEQSSDGYQENSQSLRNFATLLGTFSTGNKGTMTVFFNRSRTNGNIGGSISAEQMAENRRQVANPLVLTNGIARGTRYTRIGTSLEYELTDKLTNVTSVFGSTTELDHPLPFVYITSARQTFGWRSRMVYSPVVAGMQTRLIAGVEFQQGYGRQNNYGNLGGRPSAFRAADLQNRLSQLIVFSQAEIDLTPKTLLSAGVSMTEAKYRRQSYFVPNATNTTPSPEPQLREFDPFSAPRIGLNHRLTDKIAAHTSVSRDFTPPSARDLNNVNGSFNAQLMPEAAWNYEVGLRGTALKDRFSFDTSLFYMELNNEILPRFIEQGLTLRDDAGRTDYTGLDLSVGNLLVDNPTSFFTLIRPYLSATHINARFRDYVFNTRLGGNIQDVDVFGNRLKGIVPNRIFIGIDIETKIGLYAFATWEGVDLMPVDDPNDFFNSSYRVANTKLGWRKTLFQRLGLDVYGGIDNIFNERYAANIALNAAPVAPQAHWQQAKGSFST